MKRLIPALLFGVFVSFTAADAAHAALVINVDGCGTYGPAQGNLTVAVPEEPGDSADIGYEADGVFFTMKVSGCQRVSIESKSVLCDGVRIGSIPKFDEANQDDGGRPRGALVLEPAKSFEIAGSCNRKRQVPLSFKLVR